jgi:hypothetical protein
MLPLLALGAALAADVQPGVFLPGATRVEALTGSAGTGAFCGTDGACGPVLQADFALTRGIVVSGQAPLLFEDGELQSPFTVAGRVDLADFRVVRVAVFGTYGGASKWQPAFYGLDGLALGVAAQAGTEHVWVDASAPLVRVPAELAVVGPARSLASSEAGVNVGVGDLHTVRLGVTQLSPEASWRVEGDMLYGELGAIWNAREDEEALVGRLQAGVRF